MKRAARNTHHLRGDLEIVVREVNTNRRLRRMVIKNTITYAGMLAPLYLLAHDVVTPADYQITHLWVGTGQVPPTRGDTALQIPTSADPTTGGKLVLGPSNRTVTPATSELVITATLTAGRANGNLITEVALFLANGKMFSRQVTPDVSKTALVEVDYTWRIATSAT